MLSWLVQCTPQNSSVQNNWKGCVPSHAPPSSLVPFDPCHQYKVYSISSFSEVWREALPGWCWSACCQSEERSKRGSGRPSFSSESQVGSWKVRPQWSERQHPWPRFFRESCPLCPASFRSKRKKPGNEDRHRGDDLPDDKVPTCLRRQLSWTARRWRWQPPSPSLASDAVSAPAGRTGPQCRPSPSRSARTHLRRSTGQKRTMNARGCLHFSVLCFPFHPAWLLGGGRLLCIIKEKPAELDPNIRSALMRKEASSAF